jgi:hypothetical protein
LVYEGRRRVKVKGEFEKGRERMRKGRKRGRTTRFRAIRKKTWRRTGTTWLHRCEGERGGGRRVRKNHQGEEEKGETHTTPSPYEGTPPERTPAITAKNTAWTAAVPYL